MAKCTFCIGGYEYCEKEAVEGSQQCQEHILTTCTECGGKATESCGDSILGLTCGANLCGSCAVDHYRYYHSRFVLTLEG